MFCNGLGAKNIDHRNCMLDWREKKKPGKASWISLFCPVNRKKIVHLIFVHNVGLQVCYSPVTFGSGTIDQWSLKAVRHGGARDELVCGPNTAPKNAPKNVTKNASKKRDKKRS